MALCSGWTKLAFGLAAGLLASAGLAQSGAELSRAAAGVVALSRDGGPGAGLVVGRGAESLVVLTAAHVLGPPGDETRGLRARLQGFANRELTRVSLLQIDRRLDLAALRIDGLKAADIDPCAVPVITLKADLPVQREHAVFAVGNPAGVAWTVPATPDRVSEVGARELRFQSTVIDIGHSGGALFNVFGDLVGMIRADQPPYGVALRVGVLAKAAADWKLDAGAVPCAAARAAAPVQAGGDTAFRRWVAEAASSRAAFIAVTDYRRPSPASLAVFDNDMAALERLSAAGALLEENQGMSPLLWAVALGRREMLRYLLLKGVRLNGYDAMRIPGVGKNDGESAATALHMAARLDDAEAVRLLVKAGADVSNGMNMSNGPGSALTVAVDHNALRAAKALIEAGADPTEAEMGWSGPFPLLAALNRGNFAMLKLLRGAGAKLSIRVGSNEPSTLLSLAAEKAPVASIRWLIEQRVALECATCDSPMRQAVLANRVDVIQTLAKAGANPTGNTFEPYLCLAVSMGHADALKALLLAGANPNQAGRNGSPLAMARHAENKPFIEALLAHGAKR